MKISERWQAIKYRVFTATLILLLVTSIGLSACAEKEIVIGALLPITGDLSSAGESANTSLEIAVKDINGYLSEVGFEKRLRLIVEDTETNPEVTLEKLKYLTAEGVRVVIGPGSSAEVNEVKEYAEENDILLISHSSTATPLAISGDNVFRFVPDDTLQGEAIARLMWEEGYKAFVPMWRDDVWGGGLFEATKSSFVKLGGIVIDGISYTTTPSTPEDFSVELESLNSKIDHTIAQYDVDSVAIHLMAFQEVVTIFNQAQNYPNLSKVKWYGSDGTAVNQELISNEQAAQFAVRVGYPNPIVSEVLTEKSELIKQQIREKIERDPDVYSLVAYDALWVATKAYLATGEKTPDALKKAVRQEAKQYTGVTGWAFLNEAGDRKFGNYDFWTVTEENDTFQWKRVAIYRIDPILPGKVIYIH